MTSKKQEIYLYLLWRILPHARNVQRKPFWRRAFWNLYPELELLHSIPDLLKNPEADQHDVYWINVQARMYMKACLKNKEKHWYSEEVLYSVRELIELIPEEIKLESKVDFSLFM